MITLQSPSLLTAAERRWEAIELVGNIKAAIAGGASFVNPHASGFFADMRDALLKWGPNARVSPDQLKYLRKIQGRMRGKQK